MRMIKGVGDAESLLELAHKYDMPLLLESVKEFLMPALAPPVEACSAPLLLV